LLTYFGNIINDTLVVENKKIEKNIAVETTIGLEFQAVRNWETKYMSPL
jgi:hypothetical protein